MVFGDLRAFLPEDVLAGHVKVQMRGAFSLYRNDADGNGLFRLPHPQIDFREAFANPRYCAFDEWEGLYKLVKVNGVSFHLNNAIAEISVGRRDLRLSDHPNFSQQVLVWDDGRLVRAGWSAESREDQEFAYIHLQKRRFRRVPDLEPNATMRRFCFLPDRIVPYESDEELECYARENRPGILHDLWFSLGRPARWWQSRRLIDRRYYKIPKPG